MNLSRVVQVLVILAFMSTAGFLSGCGGSSSTSSCECGICINEVPAYPCDSEASCAAFAAAQSCNSYEFTTDEGDTCGGEPQPVCSVSGCSGQCSCPEG